jgi:hexosaminidase
MAASKFNVLHWHIVDDDSFPLELDSYPDLAKNAAFSAKEVYSKKVVKEIIEYAAKYAIRVMPEFDNPGHSRAVGLDPSLRQLIRCFNRQ